jgi:hypothetical protein
MVLVGLGHTLAFELGHDDVTVDTVLSGPASGDRIEEVLEAQTRPADVEHAHPIGSARTTSRCRNTSSRLARWPSWWRAPRGHWSDT